MSAIKNFSPSKAIVPLTIILLLLLTGLLLISFNNPLSLDDGLRHVVMAKAMLENGLYSSNFAWNNFFYEGYFANHIVDPWYLADIAYIPFIFLPIVQAIKAFIFSNIILLMLAFWYLIKPMKLPSAWIAILFAILILGDQSFLYRLFLGRPYVIMTAVTLITLKGILEKRYFLTAFSLALGVLISNLFVFPLFIAILGYIWIWSVSGLKKASKMGLSIVIGTTFGLILHPQTFEYIKHTYEAFLKIPFMKSLQVGTELYSGIFTTSSAVALFGVIILFSIICFTSKPRPKFIDWNKEGIFFLYLLTIIFLASFFIWMRTIDFLWPLEIVLLALLIKTELKKSEVLFTEKYNHNKTKSIFAINVRLVVLVLVLLLASNFLLFIQSVSKSDSSRSLEMFKTMDLIPAGSHVLNIEWDIIPSLIAVRPDLKYATGILSTYTYLDNPKVYKLLMTASANPKVFDVSLINGDKWTDRILDQYPSDYIVFSQYRFPQFIYNLRDVDRLNELSESGAVIAVFEVLKNIEN